jgi:hypothetical protein
MVQSLNILIAANLSAYSFNSVDYLLIGFLFGSLCAGRERTRQATGDTSLTRVIL